MLSHFSYPLLSPPFVAGSFKPSWVTTSGHLFVSFGGVRVWIWRGLLQIPMTSAYTSGKTEGLFTNRWYWQSCAHWLAGSFACPHPHLPTPSLFSFIAQRQTSPQPPSPRDKTRTRTLLRKLPSGKYPFVSARILGKSLSGELQRAWKLCPKGALPWCHMWDVDHKMFRSEHHFILCQAGFDRQGHGWRWGATNPHRSSYARS